MLQKEFLFDIGITNETEENILKYILMSFSQKHRKYAIFTPNPEMVVYAKTHKDFADVLNSAEISLADGVGLQLAGKILGKKLKKRLTGVDLMQKICAASGNQPIIAGFLGAQPKIAMKAAECLKKKYPKLEVAFAVEEWDELDGGEGKRWNREKRVDILFVAFGFPKQEEWIAKHLPELPVTAAMGVGGAFDYIAGVVPRAPAAVRQVGLEWLFRLIAQPWRIKRQLALLQFLWLVGKERLLSILI